MESERSSTSNILFFYILILNRRIRSEKFWKLLHDTHSICWAALHFGQDCSVVEFPRLIVTNKALKAKRKCSSIKTKQEELKN